MHKICASICLDVQKCHGTTIFLHSRSFLFLRQKFSKTEVNCIYMSEGFPTFPMNKTHVNKRFPIFPSLTKEFKFCSLCFILRLTAVFVLNSDTLTSLEQKKTDFILFRQKCNNKTGTSKVGAISKAQKAQTF